MNIIKVTEELKEKLGKHIHKNKADYFTHIREFENNFSDSHFWLALEEEKIIGTMLFDKAGTAKMRGSKEIVDAFFKKLESIPRYINVPHESSDLITKYVASEKRRLHMIRLIMEKQAVTLKEGYEIIHLKKEDMKNALKVFQAAEPEDWKNSEADKLPFDDLNQWYAIEKDGQLVSVCWNQLYNHAGHVAFIATHPDHQRKGYASALIRYTLNETFNKTNFAVIHVREDNIPALNAYRKLGYKDHSNYLILCEPEMKD